MRKKEHVCLSIETENIITVLKEDTAEGSIKNTDVVVFIVDNLCLIQTPQLF